MSTRESARVITLINEHILKLPDFVQEYISSKIRSGLSPRTLLQYIYKYEKFFNWAISEGVIEAKSIMEIHYSSLEHLKKEDIELYLDHLRFENISSDPKKIKNRGAADIDTSIISLRSLFNYLTVETEDENGECYFYRNVMKKIVINKKKETANKRARKINAKILTDEDITNFISFLENDYEKEIDGVAKSRFMRNKLRDIAIVSLILGSGIRVNELVSLEMANMNLNKKLIDVIRKGNKDDTVSIMEQAKNSLEDYLSVRESNYKGAKNCPFVFVTIYKGEAKEMTRRAVQLLVTKYTAAFNNNTGISPQKLRHSFATDYIAKGGSLITLRDQLGHNDIKTTSLYTNMNSEENVRVLNEMDASRKNKTSNKDD